MKTLGENAYPEIRTWIYRNARQLDLSLWQCLFEDGGKDAVLSALSFYQNEDGGFGHALEADCWNPNSSPYTTMTAINIIKTIGFTDTLHPILQGIIKFLGSGQYFLDHGWLFNIPSNNEYAHAPWWSYSVEDNEVESIGVTLEIISFVLECFDKNSDLYQKSVAIAEHMIDKLKTQNKYGEMGIGGYCVLLDTIKQKGLESKFDYDNLLSIVRGLVHDSIERDMSKWVNYGVRPSNYITSPDSIFYKENSDIVQKELDYLIETRLENSVWGITWSWFENNDKYPKEFAISENWWKGTKAIEKMIFLRNFGLLNK